MAISAQLKLRIYNDSLRHLGSRSISSLSEARESRRVLDTAWGGADNPDSLAQYCLEQGEWNFALRTVEAAYSPSVEPSFGFRRAFDKPDDFVRLVWISANEYGRPPMTDLQYQDEAGFWFTDVDTIYVRFVSKADDYGMDGAKWTETFIAFVAAEMAFRSCERITNSRSKLNDLASILKAYKMDARSKDAMNEGVKFAPQGSWVRSRGGWR